MSNARYAAILVIAVMVVSAVVVTMSDDSDAASSYTARVFIGDGTDSGTTELSGTGQDVEGVILDALGGRIVINPNGTVRSLDGTENTDVKSWYILQWRPPTGWVSVLANSSGNAYLESGTSYYVYYSDVGTGTDGRVTYSTPSSFKPVSTAYFFIKFVTDANANSYVTSVLTEEQRLEGFWISGQGSDIAEAFRDACSDLRAMGNSGFQLVINDDPNNELYGWLGTFMGLEDDDSPGGGLWNNWSQFSWNDSTGRWEYNNWCLGYYDPGVYPYFSVVRQITADDSATAGTGVTPSDIPSELRRGSCTVTFIGGNGEVLKTQTVPYFGSATAPSNPTKPSEDGVTYTFTGWDVEFDQVISDTRVTAQFSSSGSPTGPTDPEEPGDIGVPVSSVSLDRSSLTMEAGDSTNLIATVSPSNAEDRSVTWASSNPSVATVDQNGRVTAVSEGTATITVRTNDGGRTASAVVTVEGVADSVTLSASYIALGQGESVTLTAMTSNGAPVSWTSDNPSVVSVDNGTVTVVGSSGSAVISAMTGNSKATCKVEVITEGNAEGMDRVDLSGTGQNAYTVQFTESGMDVLEDIGNGYTLVTDIGTVSISDGVLSTIGAGGSLSMAVVAPNSGQIQALGGSTLYEYTVNGGSVSQLGGTAEITMPYVLPSGADASDVRVYQIDYRGNILEEFDCTYSDGSVTFQTTHFSLYFATVGDAGQPSPEISDDDGSGDGTMMYVGIAAVVIAVIIVAAVALTRRGA